MQRRMKSHHKERDLGHSHKPSIFSNFEFVQLNSDERLYLHAARMGDLDLMQQLLESPDLRVNYNCVDYMGRNVLHLAVEAENLEMTEMLMDKVAWECIEEALLHAISKDNLSIVRQIIDHPKYASAEKHMKLLGKSDDFFRAEEKYQYPPDITPLILAAHLNEHDIIQLFLTRGETIESPHPIYCQCQDCRNKQESDSLKRSRSRFNAYRALASPAYMALSSPDPITATFELRQEMMALAQIEKEFKKDYLALVDQCMDFACDCMNLCRGTQEMEAMLGEENHEKRDSLARLRLALCYREKRFVAHPNTQQHLTGIWYGKEMLFLQGLSWYWKCASLLFLPFFIPFFCLIYIFRPDCKFGRMMRCPVSKFITHTVSHLIFLVLLGVATFGMEASIWNPSSGYGDHQLGSRQIEDRLRSELRPARLTLTTVQMLILFWIVGNLLLECKQVYLSGAREHFRQYYNLMDWTILSLYLASYSLRVATQYQLIQADVHNETTTYTQLAHLALENNNEEEFLSVVEDARKSYFMLASRFEWSPHDPEILSDVLFAIANVLSFGRTTYIMPSHEILGPLQISLARMFGDIIRFIVVFIVVLVAFMVGMTNLYRYYGTHVNNTQDDTRASESFRGLPQTIHTLFFSMFGLISLDKLAITPPPEARGLESTWLVDRVGVVLFGIFQVSVTIVLVNMLIAMMSHSFEAIQEDNDVEWKYARTTLWLNFIDEGSTLPVPFNMLPTPKTLKYTYVFLKELFQGEDDDNITYDFTRRRENVLLEGIERSGLVFNPKTSYSDIIQRIMRRFLFQMDRKKKETLHGDVQVHRDIASMEADEEFSANQQTATEGDVNTASFADRTRDLNSTSNLELPQVNMKFSNSESSCRDAKRRTTIKRRTTVQQKPSTDQLQYIQRSQRLLDARLQDIQTQTRKEEATREEGLHSLHQMSEQNHQAMVQLYTTVQSIHTDLTLMSQAFRQYIGFQAAEQPSAISRSSVSSKPQARTYKSLSPNCSFREEAVPPSGETDGCSGSEQGGSQKGGHKPVVQKRSKGGGLGPITLRLTRRGRRAKAKSGPPTV